MKTRRFGWIQSILLIVAFDVSSATASAEVTEPPSVASSRAVSDSQAPADSVGLAEIVVTAERRTETLQKSALDIQVLSSEDLKRAAIIAPSELATFVPGVQITATGAYVETFLRGVGNQETSTFSDSAITYNINGVTIDRGYAVGSNFFDLSRVEVLKGPQGTLYGRNATGGAINIITTPPSQQFEGYITEETGNYNLFRTTGAINVPLSEQLAVRGAFQVISRDGYLSDGHDDDKKKAARISALWTPLSNVSMFVVADYARLGGIGAGYVLYPSLGSGGSRPWTGLSSPDIQSYVQAQTSGISFPLTTTARQDGHLWNVSAELNWDLGFLTVTLLPAYRHSDLDSNTYEIGFLNNHEITGSIQKSLELRLGHNTDFLKWTVGGYYFRLNSYDYLKTELSAAIPGFNTATATPSENDESYAAFGQATVSITNLLRLTGGLRYTTERRSIEGAAGDTLFPTVPLLSENNSASFSKLTYKGGLEYDITPNSMGYASISTGFKSGGFYLGPAPYNVYNPETLTAYTLGARNRFLDSRLQINGEAFLWKYKDQQISTVGYTPNGILTYLTGNAGSSTLYGVDLDGVMRITAKDSLRITAEYLHTRFDTYSIQYPNAFIGSVYTTCAVDPTLNGAPPFQTNTIDCSGKRQAHAPQYSGSVGYQHILPLADSGSLTFNLDLNLATWRYTAFEYTPEERAPGYVSADFAMTYGPKSKAWSVTAYVKNISDKPIYQTAVQDSINPHVLTDSIGAPRTYGLRVTAQF